MRSILKWFAMLLLVIFFGLLLYQNHDVLLQKHTLTIFSQELFGFSFGTVTMPLAVYFIACIILGALFMSTPAVALWVRAIKVKRQLRKTEQELLDERSLPAAMEPGDDLAYHIKDDDQEQ